MKLPQANKELTVGAMKEMAEEIDKQQHLPFTKRMSTIDGALRYTRLAFMAYKDVRATIEPIDEGIWKFMITVSAKETK